MSSDGNASTAYGPLLSELIKAQEARKASVEQRGIAVVTTSGALVTLLFGLASLLTANESFNLPETAKQPLKIALPLFVAAALLALATNAPLAYGEFDPEDLQKQLPADWSKLRSEAEGRIAATRLTILVRNHRLNNLKGLLLLAAMVFEVAAVMMVSWSVFRILSL